MPAVVRHLDDGLARARTRATCPSIVIVGRSSAPSPSAHRPRSTAVGSPRASCASFASNSWRNFLTIERSGQTAASASAQIVRPSIWGKRCSRRSRSAARALAGVDPAVDLLEPVAALAAGRALPAGLVGEEVRDVLARPRPCRRVSSMTIAQAVPEAAAGLDEVVEAHLHVELVVEEDGHRDAAGDDGLDRAAVERSARVVVDQLAQRDPELELPDARGSSPAPETPMSFVPAEPMLLRVVRIRAGCPGRRTPARRARRSTARARASRRC